MEERKLTRAGNFSFTISLPKKWILNNKLSKGKSVFLTEKEEGILVSPKKEKYSPVPSRLKVNVDTSPYNGVVRDIVAGYLKNVETIEVHGKKLRKLALKLKEHISSFSGLEIIEETSERILIKDLINLDEIIVPDLIRRIDIIIRSMLEDTRGLLLKKDSNFAKSIYLRDKEINRLVFLVSKVINYINDRPNEGKLHGLNFKHTNYIWEMNGYLEKIGDEIKRIALLIPKLRCDKKEMKRIHEVFRETEGLYLEIMGAMYKNNIQKGDKASAERTNVFSKIDDILKNSKNIKQSIILNKLKYIISFNNSISRINRYILFEKHFVDGASIGTKKTIEE